MSAELFRNVINYDNFNFLGFNFWRSPARKVFGIRPNDINNNSHQHLSRPASVNDAAYDNMMEKLNEIKTVMERNTLIPNMTNIAGLEQAIWSSSLIQPLKDAFFCMICRELPTPPVVISFCCKRVIGWNSCLENYHDHSCPHCRTEDFSKAVFTCFDTTLNILKEHLS